MKGLKVEGSDRTEIGMANTNYNAILINNVGLESIQPKSKRRL
jgi:hypothetical protein